VSGILPDVEPVPPARRICSLARRVGLMDF
jgi:hypothetical protein